MTSQNKFRNLFVGMYSAQKEKFQNPFWRHFKSQKSTDLATFCANISPNRWLISGRFSATNPPGNDPTEALLRWCRQNPPLFLEGVLATSAQKCLCGVVPPGIGRQKTSRNQPPIWRYIGAKCRQIWAFLRFRRSEIVWNPEIVFAISKLFSKFKNRIWNCKIVFEIAKSVFQFESSFQFWNRFQHFKINSGISESF